MPHLRMRGVNEIVVAKASVTLPEKLAPVLETSIDNFTFEKVDTSFFETGKKVPGYPFIEFLWFERGESTRQKVAEALMQFFREEIHTSLDVALVFVAIPKEHYFENGEHF